MAVIHLPNGIGQSAGDSLATVSPLEVNGNVWYVNANHSYALDAASPAGRSELRPLQTLSQAQASASNGDIIVLMDGHTETYTGVFTITKNVCIVGGGSSSGVPTVTFTNNSAAGVMFSFTGSGLQELRNVKIAVNAQTNAQARLSNANTGVLRLAGCYFQCGATDTGPALLNTTNGVNIHLKNCTFVSTATNAGSRPESAFKVSAAMTTLLMDGVVFDNGTVGFSNTYALSIGAAVTALAAENMSFLRGADASIFETAVGYLAATTATGAPRIDWADVA